MIVGKERRFFSFKERELMKIKLKPVLTALVLLAISSPARAENCYTNHAGNVISGVVITLEERKTTISNDIEIVKVPLSIFPEQEQRRIVADYILAHPEKGNAALRIPVAVKRAVAGAEKSMARSRKRAEKGLCSKEDSDEFCRKAESALKSYLDNLVIDGTITPAERNALGH